MIYHIYWPAKGEWFPTEGRTQKEALAFFKRQHRLKRMPMGHVVRRQVSIKQERQERKDYARKWSR